MALADPLSLVAFDADWSNVPLPVRRAARSSWNPVFPRARYLAESCPTSNTPLPHDGHRGHHPALSAERVGRRSIREGAAALRCPLGPRALEFHRRGELLMIGTFGDIQSEGSMAISLIHDYLLEA